MKKYKVSFRPRAVVDLQGLYRYIAREAGIAVAASYFDRLEDACLALENLPHRGTSRDDIRPGLRIVGFERRVAIAFLVKRSEVIIVRIFYGGRDYERALRGTPGP